MCMTKQTEEKSVKRDYKSRMFTMIFRDKKELLWACKTLGDYSEYVYRVREYAKETSIEEAVDRAIDECIREGILREFLERNHAEARAMSIYEYNQEEHIRLEREDAFEDGHKLGREEGESRLGKLITILLQAGLTDIAQLVAVDEATRVEYYKKYNID